MYQWLDKLTFAYCTHFFTKEQRRVCQETLYNNPEKRLNMIAVVPLNIHYPLSRGKPI